jgi:hypothetical protein
LIPLLYKELPGENAPIGNLDNRPAGRRCRGKTEEAARCPCADPTPEQANLNSGVFQCSLYDKDKGDAKLIGVEYVISDEFFQKQPTKEKANWHPHGFEISAGLLTFTGIKKDCEKKLVKGLHKTWGKVWQT